MVDIYLKNGTIINVSDFEEVKYSFKGFENHLQVDNFSNIEILPTYTYKFKGSNEIIVLGDEILYLELNK